MMHKSREKYLPYFEGNLEEFKVSMDDGSKGIYENCINSWELYDPQRDYHCLVQDDVIFTYGFKSKLESFINENKFKSSVIVLYLDKRPSYMKKINEARSLGKDYVTSKRIHHEIALCIPTKLVSNLIEFARKHPQKDDKFLDGWLRHNNMIAVYPMPSLIDHRNDDTLHDGNLLDKSMYVAGWFEDGR